MLLAGLGSVRIWKNCDLGLENAALGLRPRAAFSRPRSQFFPIRISQSANNVYISLAMDSKSFQLNPLIELEKFIILAFTVDVIQDSRFFIFALFISLTTAKIKIERRK